jgi:chromosome segregation ATPase
MPGVDLKFSLGSLVNFLAVFVSAITLWVAIQGSTKQEITRQEDTSNSVVALSERTKDLADRMQAISSGLTSLSDSVNNLSKRVDSMQSQIQNINDRVVIQESVTKTLQDEIRIISTLPVLKGKSQ